MFSAVTVEYGCRALRTAYCRRGTKLTRAGPAVIAPALVTLAVGLIRTG